MVQSEELKVIENNNVSSYPVPDKVIAYLKCPNNGLYRMGIFSHLYKPDIRFYGKTVYSDGLYVWDNFTWKYVMKYNLRLPESFIDHVMSEEGTAFIEKAIDESKLWSVTVKKYKKQLGYRCFIPTQSELRELDNF